MAVEFKPAGYHAVTPYLVVDGADRLITFMLDVLGGTEMMRLPGPDGRIGHAEIRVGDSVVMVADVPPSGELTTSMLHVYVADSDATYKRALAAGATSLREPTNEFAYMEWAVRTRASGRLMPNAGGVRRSPRCDARRPRRLQALGPFPPRATGDVAHGGQSRRR
jgi:PhnB protein